MLRTDTWWVAALAIAAAPWLTSAQAASELTQDQRRTIEGRGQVFVTRDVPSSSWPRACIYEYIDATPHEAAAVFIDYERHRTFIPGLKKSRISRVVDRTTTEVDYTLAIPIVADEQYTVRDHVGIGPDSVSVTVSWTLVRASSTKATEGSARFEPFRAERPRLDGTLMAYCNLVTPGSRLAKLGFVKSRAMNQVRETAHAVAKQVERERTSDPTLLTAQLLKLRAALSTDH